MFSFVFSELGEFVWGFFFVCFVYFFQKCAFTYQTLNPIKMVAREEFDLAGWPSCAVQL